jgi:hypothetical protein
MTRSWCRMLICVGAQASRISRATGAEADHEFTSSNSIASFSEDRPGGGRLTRSATDQPSHSRLPIPAPASKQPKTCRNHAWGHYQRSCMPLCPSLSPQALVSSVSPSLPVSPAQKKKKNIVCRHGPIKVLGMLHIIQLTRYNGSLHAQKKLSGCSRPDGVNIGKENLISSFFAEHGNVNTDY